MRLGLHAERQRLATLDDYLTLFEDKFNGSAINTNRWTVTDTENKITVSGGNLVFAGGLAAPAWGDPRVAKTVSFPRKAGLILEFEITKSNVAQDGPLVGWASAVGVALPEVAWYFYTSLAQVAFNGSAIGASLAVTNATSYWLRIVLKAVGFLAYISTDNKLTWKLAWENATDTTDPVFVMYVDWAAAFTSTKVDVDHTIPKPPILSDTFTRDDSALTLGNAETGQAWTADIGTWGISSNQAYCVSATSLDQATIDTSKADGIWDVTVKGTFNSGTDYNIAHLFVRLLDNDNTLMAYLNSGNIYLGKRDGGVYSTLGSAATATADNTDYALRVVAVGNRMLVYKDGTELITYTLAGGDTRYNAYTKCGMSFDIVGTPATDARWDGFKFQGGLP